MWRGAVNILVRLAALERSTLADPCTANYRTRAAHLMLLPTRGCSAPCIRHKSPYHYAAEQPPPYSPHTPAAHLHAVALVPVVLVHAEQQLPLEAALLLQVVQVVLPRAVLWDRRTAM